MSNFKSKIKKQFLTGLIVILPLGLTLWIAWVIFRFIGRRFLPYLEYIPHAQYLPQAAQMIISALTTLLIIWLIGLWAHNFAGRFFLGGLEKIVLKTPFVSKIYKTIKQLTNTMFVNREAFKKVALIEYPRRGIGTLVFVTNENKGNTLGKKLTTVFVPSTPNPTTGFCIMLPEEDVHELPITVNQAIEFIFSGGIIVPEDMNIPAVLMAEQSKKEQ